MTNNTNNNHKKKGNYLKNFIKKSYIYSALKAERERFNEYTAKELFVINHFYRCHRFIYTNC